jgi:TolB-like protein/DNA-binding winged helix-turn-helix (wHTH) protein
VRQVSQPDFRFGEYFLNVAERRLLCRGESVALTPKAFDTLLLLVKNAGHLVEKEAFLKQLWPNVFVEESSLAQNISVLRKVLGDDGNGSKFIETVPKRGYRFVAEVREAVEESLGAGNGGGAQERTPLSVVQTAGQERPSAAGAQGAKWHSARVGLYITLIAIMVIALGASYVFWQRLHAQARSVAHRAMLAVLPFQNLSGDRAQEYVSDGLTEEMITQLGRMDPQQLGVIARTSAMAYKDTRKTSAEIGRELGVDYVLEGSVRRENSRVRVSAQLIQVKDQTHLWAQNYDRDMRDILSLQGEVAQSIAEEIQIKLTRQGGSIPPKNRSVVDVEAYEIYLRGLYYWNRRSQTDLQRGIAYFQQAIERDPSNALAYAGLADSYFVRAISGAVPTQDAMPKAKAAALKALELDDSLAEAHTSLAQISANYEWNWSKAEFEYKKAIELNPNYSTGHHYYATFLMGMGRHTEALDQMKRAQELDPLSPVIATFIGKAYYYARNNEEAIRQYRKVLDSDPAFPLARSFLINSLEVAGRFDDAVTELKIEAAQLGRSGEEAEARSRTYQKGGADGYWKEALRQREAGADLGAGLDLDTASIYARLGDKDEAFLRLNRACDQRNMWLMNLKVDPRFDNLRSDPRFQSLLHRVGLL